MPRLPAQNTDTHSPDGISAAPFAVRVLVGALYAVAVVGALWFGRLSAGIVFGLFAGLAAAEFYALERREARLPNEFIGIAAAGAMPVAAALWGHPGLSALVTALAGASLVWHVLFPRVRIVDTATTLLGAIYTGFLLAFIVLLREFSIGLQLSLALVVSIWANDSFAYLVGSTIGRHKMAPRISPKKSWEGFVAGFIATEAVWIAVPRIPGVHLSLGWALVTGAAVALSAVVGDLFESRIKREAGVKDSGDALPGHGGFLDRLDSLILAAMVAYWCLTWGGIQ